jgi:hypothetical protein
MKTRFALIAAVVAASCSRPEAPPAPPQSSKPIADLEGRVAGKPQRCMNAADKRIIFYTADADPGLLLFDDGKVIWANRLAPGCSLGPGENAVPDSTASYYCKGDFVRAGGATVLSPFGARCTLGNFTPYAATAKK